MSSQVAALMYFSGVFFFSLHARFHKAGLTSDDGQLSVDSDFALRVLGNTFVDVLVARRSQGLDSEHGASSLVKLNGLQGGEGGKKTPRLRVTSVGFKWQQYLFWYVSMNHKGISLRETQEHFSQIIPFV